MLSMQQRTRDPQEYAGQHARNSGRTRSSGLLRTAFVVGGISRNLKLSAGMDRARSSFGQVPLIVSTSPR